MSVFLDSSGLIASIRRNDGLHRQAAAVISELATDRTKLITSEWVLSEFLAGASKRPLRRAAIIVVDQILTSSAVEVIPSGPRSFAAALELFRSRPDKDWSLVDCSSILICRARGIRQVFTSDHHFKQAGLDVLLR